MSVRSEDRDGHLFFADGQIVHAFTGHLVGEDAVYEILNWTTGTFGHSNAPWPSDASVSSSWQQLLLCAAQKRDEEQPGFPGASTSRLMAVKRALSSTPGPPSGKLMEAEATVSLPRPQRKRAPVATPTRERAWVALAAIDSVKAAARFDDKGNLLEVRGDAEELIALAAYVRRLADVMGDGLGQTGFRSFECRCATTDLVLFVDAPGSYVVAETTALNELRPLYRPGA